MSKDETAADDVAIGTYKLVNIYGPTENTVNSTMCVVPAGLVHPPPIGHVVPNTQCYVLDKLLQKLRRFIEAEQKRVGGEYDAEANDPAAN